MHSQATKQDRYRARLRAQGLRPLQLWVPDTRRPGFAEECRRQSLAVRSAPGEADARTAAAAATVEGWE